MQFHGLDHCQLTSDVSAHTPLNSYTSSHDQTGFLQPANTSVVATPIMVTLFQLQAMIHLNMQLQGRMFVDSGMVLQVRSKHCHCCRHQ